MSETSNLYRFSITTFGFGFFIAGIEGLLARRLLFPFVPCLLVCMSLTDLSYFNIDIMYAMRESRTPFHSKLTTSYQPCTQLFQPIKQKHHPNQRKNTLTHSQNVQTSSSNIPSNSSLANGTLNLSVPIPSLRDSTI
jgi:hypothetical protein